jgi:hypothetical protein
LEEVVRFLYHPFFSSGLGYMYTEKGQDAAVIAVEVAIEGVVVTELVVAVYAD